MAFRYEIIFLQTFVDIGSRMSKVTARQSSGIVWNTVYLLVHNMVAVDYNFCFLLAISTFCTCGNRRILCSRLTHNCISHLYSYDMFDGEQFFLFALLQTEW